MASAACRARPARARLAVVVAVVLAGGLLAAAVPATAHTPGSAPVAQSGTFVLQAEGTFNSKGLAADEFHAYFSEMGFPIGTGDTFEIDWSVNNGSGPEVYFEIHTHENGWRRYYTNTTTSLNLTWVVPAANDSFMIYWVNHWPFAVNVTYSIVDKAPAAGPTPLLLVPVIIVGAAFGWFLWVRSVPEEERQGPGGRPVAGPPGAGEDTPGEPGKGKESADAAAAADDGEAFARAVMEAETKKGGSPPRGGGGGGG